MSNFPTINLMVFRSVFYSIKSSNLLKDMIWFWCHRSLILNSIVLLIPFLASWLYLIAIPFNHLIVELKAGEMYDPQNSNLSTSARHLVSTRNMFDENSCGKSAFKCSASISIWLLGEFLPKCIFSVSGSSSSK